MATGSHVAVVGPVHKAAPGNEAGYCAACGQHIKKVPGGQGPTWVHADSGAVAAPNPPHASIPEVLERLLAAYDRQYRDATEFARGSFEHEAKKVLVAISEAGGKISFLGEGEPA